VARDQESGNTKQRVALVTGASRGIGAQCALTLGHAGFKVAVHYRGSEEGARKIVAQIPDGFAKAFQADLTQPEECQNLIKSVKEEWGTIDVLVNNAGIAVDQILAFAKIEDFDRLLATNLRPVFLLSKLAAKLMIRQKWGRIINISSVVGYTGNAGQSMYASTKAAIVGFTRSIAQELAGVGILCNVVAPGFIETDMTQDLTEDQKNAILAKIPLKRMGSVQDIADAVEFLASDKAQYVTGTTLHVNGGMYLG
jgi:3-oxoacyl-[acyl-carrier protein] reductase